MLTRGAVVGAANEIRMTIDELKSIANAKIPGLKADATQSRDRFRNLALPACAFSEFPEAQDVARQHEGAHEVFVDTINGVIADLESFEQKLRESVGSAETTDEQVEASLAALGRRLSAGGHVFASERGYQRSNQHNYDNLSAGRGGDTARTAEVGSVDGQSEPADQNSAPTPAPDGSPTASEGF